MLEAAGARVGGGREKAEGRTANPGVDCSPKIPGAPPNSPVNLVELLENVAGTEEEGD